MCTFAILWSPEWHLKETFTHQVIDLIGQLDFLICIFQSFVVILRTHTGLTQKPKTHTTHTHAQKQESATSDLFNDLHLLLSPLWFVLLGVDEELDDLLLQLIRGIWRNKQERTWENAALSILPSRVQSLTAAFPQVFPLCWWTADLFWAWGSPLDCSSNEIRAEDSPGPH